MEPSRIGRTVTADGAAIETLSLNNTQAYLEYVVSKEKVFLFVLTSNKSRNGADVKAYPLSIKPSELAKKVEQFQSRLANRHPEFAGLARELYGSLIGPAAQDINGVDSLCIVPDGFLWNLPFQAPLTTDNYYLTEDYAISYVPSLRVLREMSKSKNSRGNPEATLMALGNPVIGKDEQHEQDLCPLPEAEAEVKAISKGFSPSTNKVLIGREASERAFKALASNYSVLHFATHGVLDNRNPLYSHLLLTKTEADSENDGLLEAREIMKLRLHADLAVLSACETANGRIAPGEGVIGMSWAFFVAGPARC